MKTTRFLSALPLLGILALGACDDTGPMGLDDETLSVADQLTLELLADPAATQAALELAGGQTSMARRRGRAFSTGESYALQAQVHFQNAQQALAQGNQTRALEQAREGRRMVVRAMEAAGGPMALGALVEHLSALPLAVTSDPAGYEDCEGLGNQLGQLAEGARNQYRKGNRIQAGELGVLAEQAVRARRRTQEHTLAAQPEVLVELASAAVTLADGLLQAAGADEEQLTLLAAAQEYLAQAVAAQEGGDTRAAAHFAHLAEWWALKAVVIPGGITDEEVLALRDLATTLLADATAAVGSEPTELQADLLAKATRMLETGVAAANNGTCRGLGAVWQAAVIASYLLS